MDALQFCRKTYRERVEARQDINTELKRALRAHERVPKFIDNLAHEMKSITWNVKKETLEKAVYDLTDYFIQCVERKATEDRASDMTKAMAKIKQSQAEEFRQAAEALDKQGEEYVERTDKGEIIRSVTEI